MHEHSVSTTTSVVAGEPGDQAASGYEAEPGNQAARLDQAAAVAALEAARARTLGLMDQVTESHLRRQWTSILSPMVWDLGHIGNYEDLWVVRTLAGERERVTPPGLDPLYDAFQQPRDQRETLPLLGPDEARRYIRAVRERSLRAIDDGLLDPARAAGPAALVRDGFVLGLVVQHEQQHAETILQTRQAMGEAAVPLEGVERTGGRRGAAGPGGHGADAGSGARGAAGAHAWVTVPADTHVIGTDDDPWAYDNERGSHLVTLPSFRIARDPVTCGDWCTFIDAGGYGSPEHWHPDGWVWAQRERAAAPMYWRRVGAGAHGAGAWQVLRFGRWLDLDPLEPVQHVSWWEADAFARWSGARLPTEQEWEVAARLSQIDGTGDERRQRALNAGQLADGPRRVSVHGAASTCAQILGDVWEWTSSVFAPWPGFQSFPYREYSEAHFGAGYRVLRGGSWATDPAMCRPSFRNWDLPQRRQLFAGLRLATDT